MTPNDGHSAFPYEAAQARLAQQQQPMTTTATLECLYYNTRPDSTGEIRAYANFELPRNGISPMVQRMSVDIVKQDTRMPQGEFIVGRTYKITIEEVQ